MSLGSYYDSFKNKASSELESVENSVESTAETMKNDLSQTVQTARNDVSKVVDDVRAVVAPRTPPPPAPVNVPEDIAGKSDAINRILAGGPPSGVPILSRVLGRGGHETGQVLDILNSCKGGAEIDAVLTHVGRQRLIDTLDSLEKSGPAVAAAIDKVRASDVKPGDWDAYNHYLDEVTGTTVRPGNKVTLLTDGAQAFPEIYKAIDGAKSSVNVETYQFGNDDTGREYAQHLIDAAKRGVTVNVLTDRQANLLVGGHAMVDLLRKNGVNVIENPGEPLMGSMDHRKFCVVDGTTGFCGGMNIGDMYAKGTWHDMHSKLEGPAVADLQQAFLNHWQVDGGSVPEGVDYFPPISEKGGEPVRVVPHQGGTGGDENIRLAYLRAIDTADSSIKIEDPFFVDGEVLDHIARAAKRGVDVSVVWPGDNADPTQSATARSRYAALLQAGVKVYEIPGMAHEKVCAIDGKFATIGSSNLDTRSLRRDWEMNLVMTEPEFAGTLDAQIDRDIARSTRITKPPTDLFHRVADPLLQKQGTEEVIGGLP